MTLPFDGGTHEIFKAQMKVETLNYTFLIKCMHFCGFRCDNSSLLYLLPENHLYCKIMFVLRTHNEKVVSHVPFKKIKRLSNYKLPFRSIFLFYEQVNVVIRKISENDICVPNIAIIFSNLFITNQ